MNQLKSLTSRQREILEANNWTIFGLADAKPGDLAKYRGIGVTTAIRIIKEAKVLLPSLMVEPEPKTEPDEQSVVSVRVKRIRELNQ